MTRPNKAPAATTTTSTLPGLHHVTAITGDVRQNVAFYTGTLGQRMVKVTVNYDDPTSYHLYYGDRLGTPGTLITFFGWPQAPRVRGGSGQTRATAYAADPDAIPFWRGRLTSKGVKFEESTRFGERVLRFADRDGMTVEIVGTPDSNPEKAWTDADGIPAEHALRGFHSVTLLEANRAATEKLLTEHLGFERVASEGDRTRFRANGGTSAALVDVVEQPGTPRGHDGAGQVHHIAFRTPDDPTQLKWQGIIAGLGLRVSPVMDRDYFHSIYFREPGGVLFEIATDQPGMTINEPEETLGQKLMLPKSVEPYRAQLEKVLPPLR
jgi:glyoxalase family protein